MALNDDDLLRYSRQIMLPEIDAEGQMKLADSTVLVVGLGGLGSAASIYLAAGGVGRLVLVDFDRVDLSNLQRQILHTTERIGQLKTDSARDHLLQLNPRVELDLVDHRLEGEELDQRVTGADVVVDATDNFSSRFLLNQSCVQARKPLVSAAAVRFEAQFSVFDPRDADSPCYRCLYGEDVMTEETCTANGVLAPLLGVMGSIQACEAMKLIMGIGRPLIGELLLLDILNMEWHRARLPRDPGCPVCGSG